MIVRMHKIGVVVQAKDAAAALEELRRLGVLHVEHQQPPASADIAGLLEDDHLVSAALEVLAHSDTQHRAQAFEQKPLSDWRLACRHLVDLDKRLDQLKEYGLSLQAQISQWQPWGDFDPGQIERLAAHGILVRLYRIPAGQISEVPAEAIVRTVSRVAGTVLCAVISRTRIDLPFKEIALPKFGLGAMRSRIEHDESIAQGIRHEILQHLCHTQSLEQAGRDVKQRLEFQRALAGMGRQGELAFIVGYAPQECREVLISAARQQRWAISLEEPSDDDIVPTLIRNPRWISIIEPVFRFIDIVPGYRELDISLVFLIFFSVFFGMLIGDAGIGMVFLLATAGMQLKFGKAVQPATLFILLYLLSLCAVTWGALSGTFFGQEWLPARVQPLLPALRDNVRVQSLCFFIGALHLSIGHAWRALVKAPSLEALADIGWICILWAAFFLARTLVLGAPLAGAAQPLFIAGTALVILFAAVRKNIVRGIGEGLVGYLLSVINSFTDVVSYIRLFAVGMATVAIADSFNRMAADVGCNSPLAVVATALILLVGHSLNIVLAPMSVLVHGVRLNILEFCSHIDIKWSGLVYKPLRS